MHRDRADREREEIGGIGDARVPRRDESVWNDQRMHELAANENLEQEIETLLLSLNLDGSIVVSRQTLRNALRRAVKGDVGVTISVSGQTASNCSTKCSMSAVSRA